MAGTGSNDTRHAIELTERGGRAGVDAVLSVTPYYNKPNRRGIMRHFEEVAKAAAGTPVILYNIPGRTAVNMPPDLLAELAQIDGIEAVKQANAAELQPIDGLRRAGRQRRHPRRVPGPRRRRRHLRLLAHRRAGDAAHARRARRRAEIDASLRDVYARSSSRRARRRTKAALKLLGHDAGDAAPAAGGGRRGRDWRRSARCSSATGCSTAGGRAARARSTPLERDVGVLPLGGVGEIGKNMTVVEYDGRIVVVDCGLRFPTAERMGIDLVLPDFTYLRERVDDIEAIVITHGHEDHLGALPWVLRELGRAPRARRLRRPAHRRAWPAPSSTSTSCATSASRCCRSAR